MMRRTTKTWLWSLCFTAVLSATGGAMGVEVGEAAPDFTLPSTGGRNVRLSEFRGKKSVLLEFYVADTGVT